MIDDPRDIAGAQAGDDQERDDHVVSVSAESSEQGGRRPRWWSIGAGVAILLAIGWACATAWVGIMGSSPAYLLTLLVVLVFAVGLIGWAVLAGPPPRRSKVRLWLARGGLLLGGVVLIGMLVYLRPLSAEQIALDALDDGDGVAVAVSRSEIRLRPDSNPRSVGLAFYPGARVDPQAYAHVLRPIAEAGFEVVIFKQPYNLAVLDANAADAVVGDPDDAIDEWVVAGHSLGGAMAARYAEAERDELVGLLLYAAYPVIDMSEQEGLAVMSVFGTADGVADRADIADRMSDLPPSTEFVAIEGAIHSFFGDYGLQRGDGTPGVTRADAQREIAVASLRFLGSVENQEAAAS